MRQLLPPTDTESNLEVGPEKRFCPRWIACCSVVVIVLVPVLVVAKLVTNQMSADNDCWAFNECWIAEGTRRSNCPLACRIIWFPTPQEPHCNNRYYCVDSACPRDTYEIGLEQIARQNVQQWHDDGKLIERLRNFLSSSLDMRLANLSAELHGQTSERAQAQLVASSWGDALRQLSHLRGLQTKDVFAFRETWSDEDSRILEQFSPTLVDGFAEGRFSTETFKQRLPLLSTLEAGFAAHDIAIVGSGANLQAQGLGSDIDGHHEVARFNKEMGDNVNAEDVGTRLTIHVMNYQVAALNSPGVKEFDLEYWHPWNSYCDRMFLGGATNVVNLNLFMIRPSVICKLGFGIKSFTRGFLFFWFVGRFFKNVDIYGMKGVNHYNATSDIFQGPIVEKFLRFEHLVYEKADELGLVRYV